MNYTAAYFLLAAAVLYAAGYFDGRRDGRFAEIHDAARRRG